MSLRDGKRRATREDEKQQRYRAILEVAWQLFQETSYQSITMAEVAEKAGLAKGTVYLYFRTKEELFLAVQEQQLEEWFGEVGRLLLEMEQPANIEKVSGVLCGTLEQRPALTRLLVLLHSVLEQNVDYETALSFKRFLLVNLSRTGSLLEDCLPFLNPGQGMQFLLRAHAFIIGLKSLSDPAPHLKKVLDEPDLKVLEVDFASEFSNTMQTLLYGLERQNMFFPTGKDAEGAKKE